MEVKYTIGVSEAISESVFFASQQHHEFVTPEHLLIVLLRRNDFRIVVSLLGKQLPSKLKNELTEYISHYDCKSDKEEPVAEFSVQFQDVLFRAAVDASKKESCTVYISDLVNAIYTLKDSFAEHLLSSNISSRLDFIKSLEAMCIKDKVDNSNHNMSIRVIERNVKGNIDKSDDQKNVDSPVNSPIYTANILINKMEVEDLWRVVGRDKEIDKMIETICRHDKNNILLVGEPNVGRSTVVRGLLQRIGANEVPRRLRGCDSYEVDFANVVMGAQVRAEVEYRIKSVVDELVKKAKSPTIVYFKNAQIIMSIGLPHETGFDTLSALNAALYNSSITVICSATREAVVNYKNHGRRTLNLFQEIEVNELTQKDTKRVINRLKYEYGSFHDVKYTDEAIDYAIEMSVKHIKDSMLPVKAIDLIDSVGARSESLGKKRRKVITPKEVADTLIHSYGIKNVVDKNERDALASLGKRMLSKIYGQDDAINSVVSSVQMWKAGLSDGDKPIASLLFVGPTGVGKTEVAKTLAEEMGVALQRFDMSEYVEKHTVAKLIGSPAGYVGYEDGGLLTKAILKTPNCVLLLDEIEKAHSDIYNILLQIMDYGFLTDSQGQKANFKNVVVIMTSNAGAQYAHLSRMGYSSTETAGSSMLTEVKKVFKPEFINRLTGTIVFNDMDEKMAELILNKKLNEFKLKLSERNIKMAVSSEAHSWLLAKGITKEYGAREIDRAVSGYLKPLFVKEILFGKLKNGGNVTVDLVDGSLAITVDEPQVTSMEVVIETDMATSDVSTGKPTKRKKVTSAVKSPRKSSKKED